MTGVHALHSHCAAGASRRHLSGQLSWHVSSSVPAKPVWVCLIWSVADFSVHQVLTCTLAHAHIIHACSRRAAMECVQTAVIAEHQRNTALNEVCRTIIVNTTSACIRESLLPRSTSPFPAGQKCSCTAGIERTSNFTLHTKKGS